MKSTMKLLLAVVVLTVLAAGCGKKDSAEADGRMTIAVIPKGTIHEFWQSVHLGAVKAGREADVEIIWKGPLKEDDRESQVAVVENIIARGVSGIVLAPLDDTALRMPVKNAMRAGIPVVIFDSGLKGKDFVSYVATDNFEGGKIAGRHMGKLLDGKGKVAVLRYSEGSYSTTKREDGFLDAIKQFPEIEVVSSNQYAGVTTESALQAAENMFQRFTDKQDGLQIDGIFCATEPTTLGILRAMENTGMAGKIKFVGFDTSEMMISAMRKGNLSGFVVQDPVKIGYLGVKTILQHLNGQEVEGRVDTGAVLITLDNIDQPQIQQLLKPDLSELKK